MLYNKKQRIMKRLWLIPATCLFVLSLSVLLLGARVAIHRIGFAVGDRASTRMLVNFHAIEQNATEHYRWSQDISQLFLYGYDGRPVIMALRLVSPRPAGSRAAVLGVQAGSQLLVQVPIAAAWRRYQLLIPTTSTGETGLQLLSTTFRPGHEDTRDVGVAITSGTVWPVDETAWLPGPQRALFLATLPLLVGLLFWRLGARVNWALGAGGLVASGVAWAASHPFDAGYLLPTMGWPGWPVVPLLVLAMQPALVRGLHLSLAWVPRVLPFAPWVGVAVALTALLWLRLKLNVAIGLGLLLIGTFVLVSSVASERARGAFKDAVGESAHAVGRIEAACLIGLVLMAGGLRFYHLDTQPLGLWRDEARHGLLALQIWHDPTFRPIYVVEGADLPALLFYLMAPVVGIFGPHLWSLRFVSALAGALAPLALWWATRPMIGARPALYAMALLAWTSWSLSLSRWAFPVTLDQLFVLLAIGLMWRALAPAKSTDRPSSWFQSSLALTWWPVLGMSLAALCAGLSTYTYHTGRLAPGLLAILTVLRLGWSRTNWRRALPALAVGLLVGLLVVFPLVRFILSDYDGYTRRTDLVAVVNAGDADSHAPLILLTRNIERYLLMWHVQGEANGRHHAPGAPMLDPFAGLLLLVGLGTAVLYHRRVALVLGVWLVLGLAPGLLSTGAPHAMRSFGALAPACTLVGVGLAALCQAVQPRTNSRLVRVLPYTVGLASLLFNGWLYFVNMAHDPAVYDQFDIATTAMARVATTAASSSNAALRGVHVFLPVDDSKGEVRRFLLSGSSTGWVEGSQLSGPPGEQALVLLPVVTSPAGQQAALYALGPQATPITDLPCYPQGEGPLFRAFTIGNAPARLLTVALPPQLAPDCMRNRAPAPGTYLPLVGGQRSTHTIYLPFTRR